MVPFPGEWVQQFGMNMVTAYPPDLGARFRYCERLRPQPSFATIVERSLASDPDFAVHHVGEMIRIVTVEGEYGAWVRIDGRREGRAAAKFIGAVFVDEFASSLEVIAILPEHFAHVSQMSLDLIRRDVHDMTARPRRFFYVPPLDWQPVMSASTTNWYPLDFPNERTTIAVPPAANVAGRADQAREEMVARLQVGLANTTIARDEIVSMSGDAGIAVRLQGSRAGNPAPLIRELAMFVVQHHIYRFVLETQNAARLLQLRDVFHAVARSFKPLPSALEVRLGTAFATQPDALFSHWVS
ncbi:MAG: hypothetical protein AB7T06_40980 [Kofleriaceae bacterium]